MSALSRIRNNIGLVAFIIFIALAGFILTDAFVGISSWMASAPEAGTVAGQEITWQEYQNRISQQSRGAETELQRGQVADAVWNQMVAEIAYNEEFEKIGLITTSEELVDMMVGNNVRPEVMQFFGMDANTWDPNRAKQILQYLKQQQPEQVKLLEDYLLRIRPQERLQNMVQRGFVGSMAWARQLYREQNRKVDLTYLGVNYSQIPDSAVSISQGDLEDYLEAHEEQYKQDGQTFISYINFDINPSSADTASAISRINRLRGSFGATKDDSAYMAQRSRVPFTDAFQPITSLPESVRDSMLSASEGAVIGPVREGAFFKLYKLIAREEGEDTYANINHILITPKGTTAADTAAARSKAAELTRTARNGDFAQLAQQNSDDVVSQNNGGALGWYNKARFDDAFNSAITNASVGSVVGPLKGPGGFHVVQVVAKTKQTFKTAQIEEEIAASTETSRQISKQANQVASQLKQSGNINEVAQTNQLIAQPSGALTAESRNISGLNGGRDVIIWALNADVGETSRVLSIDNSKKVVAQVVRRIEPGILGLEDSTFRAQIEALVRKEKKAEIITERLNELQGQDLNGMKEAYGDGAFVSTATNISFETNTIPGIGADKYIIGRAAGLAQGEISQPLKGDNGVFVLQATKVVEAPEPDIATLKNLIKSRASVAAAGLRSKIEPAIKELAEVDDNRANAEWRYLQQ